MYITAGILFYLLNEDGCVQHICHGADRVSLVRLEYFHGENETEEGVLYVHAESEGVLLFCSKGPQLSSRILNDTFSSLWIPLETVDRSEDPASEVFAFISRTWSRFLHLQNEILEAVIGQECVDAVLERTKRLLREPFVVVDRDMLLLYDHPEVAARMRAELGDNYSDKVIEELLIAKEFHEVARKREPFYYQMQSIGPICYCVNIVADGYYYARLVVYLEDGKQRLSSGAEQMAEYVAAVLVQMIRVGSLKVQGSRNDHLHMVITRLLQGACPTEEEFRDAMAVNGWSEGQTLQVFFLKPYHATGWDTQIENTMPTMIRKMEQTWRHSCATFSGNQILWIINHSLSADHAASYELMQQMMILLRDNVLKAGASSEFQNSRLLGSALNQAKAALEIGSKTDPSYWYYRFDDYRLAFMTEAIREKQIDPMLLVHPAIPLLLQYDQIHESELTKTLQILIEKRGNVTQAAGTLYIHRTTLFRRLNQICEITKLDLEDKEQMLEVEMSFRIL